MADTTREALAAEVKRQAEDYCAACADYQRSLYAKGTAVPQHDVRRHQATLYAAIDRLASPEQAPAVQAPELNGPEFTDWGRAAILWVLWHHQGGSSPVGQPLRFALGMGAHDHLNDEQVAAAKRWGALNGREPGSCRASLATTPAVQAEPAGRAMSMRLLEWRAEAANGRRQLYLDGQRHGIIWILKGERTMTTHPGLQPLLERFAREAGASEQGVGQGGAYRELTMSMSLDTPRPSSSAIERFAALVAEECATLALQQGRELDFMFPLKLSDPPGMDVARSAAAAIRHRFGLEPQ